MNWAALNEGHPVISRLAKDWQALLDGKHQERVYHDFLKRNATLFLADGIDSYFAISKIKLGSEFELDFAVPYEDHSRGFFWELIEIKRPAAAPYTGSGLPSAALTEATQQIRNWRRWIQTSRTEAKKIFSLWSVRSVRQPNFRYTIITGTRENSASRIDERNQYAEENGIQVRSFDYLTDRLKRRIFLKRALLRSGDWDVRNPGLGLQLANPFIEALTDSQWKNLLREPDVGGPHFMANSCEALLKHRTENRELLNEFRAWLRNQQKMGSSSEA